jgi:hypothetical protein
VKAAPFQRGRAPWRGESPGELRAFAGLNRRGRWRTLARSKTLKTGDSEARTGIWVAAAYPRQARRNPDRDVNSELANVQRATALETAYGCARGTKLWRAQPHERIRSETRPTDMGR